MGSAGRVFGAVEPRHAAGGVRDADALAAEMRRRLGPAPERSAWPLVSIVVINRDGLELLRPLLVGLTEHTDYPALELIVIDNASSDDSIDFLRKVAAPFPISIRTNAHNESFADACNQGAEIASGELLLFLNNDAEPFESGWLRELVACLEESGSGGVGPTLLEPSDEAAGSHGYVVQQRGLWLRDVQGQLAPGYRDRLADPLGQILGEDARPMAIVAACLLIDSSRFRQVGGFSRGYWYGPEDLDLSLKLRRRGVPPVCSGRSVLIHPPNSTLKRVDASQRGAWVRGNRRLFLERWGPCVRRELALDRLAGGGLWAEPVTGSAAADDAASRAEWEALGYCLCLAAPGDEEEGLLAELEQELRRRGRRCLVQRGAEVDGLASLDYDVAVHLRGRCRYVPKPAQLNVLLCTEDPSVIPSAERRHYDVVLDARGQPNRAATLVAAVEARAKEEDFATRVGPEAAPHVVSAR